MARPKHEFVCQSCGTVAPKWQGKCESCGEWNTLVEEAVSIPGAGSLGGGSKRASRITVTTLSGPEQETPRLLSGTAEFDRVTGGGLVPSGAVLIGGDPGIGKSTLLLQAAARLAKAGHNALYITGEEAISQVKLRASRLGLADAPVSLAAETSLRNIVATLETGETPAAVVIDSIQTVWSDTLESAPGTVAQVRACAQELIRCAKRRGIAMLIVGHVTKEGQLAGPRVMEHMVDTVLYFEGERGHQFRILRAVKNRYGPVDEIGVFEMTGAGLSEVTNPSALFLGDRSGDAAGTAVFAGIEGTRPVLVEIQALVAPSVLGTPRRAVVGWDSGRLSMILAVLDTRCGVGFGGHDVFLNVAGGLRITEPAADLAVAAALLSSATGTPVPPDGIVFGEVSLTGATRSIGQADARLKEAAKLGFKSAWVPDGLKVSAKGVEMSVISNLDDLVARFDGAQLNERRA